MFIDSCKLTMRPMSLIGTMTVKSCEAPRSVHYEQSKLKFILNTNKEELRAAGAQWCQVSDCSVNTMVLGIYAAGAQWCQESDYRVSTLVLGIWCGKRPRQNWTSGRQDAV